MTLDTAYHEIEKRLDTLDFSALWRSFRPTRFALYRGDSCYFDGAYMEKPEEFIANTSVEYRGEHIAIWDLAEEPEDLDALTASIVHEMFHAFQGSSGEGRWADEMDALTHYRYAAKNLSGKLREAALMRDILQNGARSRYGELLAARKARWERFPYEYDYESRIEQIEGSANDVELRALNMLDAEKARRQWDAVWETLAQPEKYVPVRIISYLTGAALLGCIRACSDYDCEAFTKVPFAEGVLAGVAAAKEDVPPDRDVALVIAAYEEKTRSIIDSALEKDRVVLRGDYPLVSLNVWDARWDGRCAVSNHFVAYRDGDAERTLSGDFVVKLNEARHIIAVYEI